jgi:hypothetical protein
MDRSWGGAVGERASMARQSRSGSLASDRWVHSRRCPIRDMASSAIWHRLIEHGLRLVVEICARCRCGVATTRA